MRAAGCVLLASALLLAAPAWAQEDEEGDPAEVTIGERLFLETRFAEFFARNAAGVNVPLAAGDPVMQSLSTVDGPIPSPFAGTSMNCRSCHLVDDAKAVPGGGSRSYADFARRSPIPLREDGRTETPRNSPSLVNASLPRGKPFFLHFDGEFRTAAGLVRGTITGRNYGWLPSEAGAAVAHVARVIREDDGSGPLGPDFGGAYRRVLAGADPTLPKALRLPRRFRVDVDTASDDAIMDAVSRLVGAYVESLAFAQDDDAFVGSPYDRFLAKNHLPTKQADHESEGLYRARLRTYLANLDEPEWVTNEDGPFALHDQAFAFGPTELEGLRIFLDPRRGNCAACHVPPTFTDFAFHDTGVTELDYDAAHGEGAFAALAIPDRAGRDADPDAYLPASPAHPLALEPFRAVVDPALPGRTDLGVWNVYQNPDHGDRRQQRRLDRLVCASTDRPRACRRASDAVRLDAAIGLFKTPGLRDLGHSGPYLHTGAEDGLEDVVRFYQDTSARMRAGALRNGAPELRQMTVGDADVAPLVAFLRSLNEDYE